MKYILIIGDGMADNPIEKWGGQTPLERAKIPTTDDMAARGVLGSVRTIPSGYPPGSDTAIMSIFGCGPARYYSGRAPIEAAAQDIRLEAGDAAFRCNNIGLSDAEDFPDKTILSHSGGGIPGRDSMELVRYLFAHPDFSPLAAKARLEIKPSCSYRHLVIQKDVNIQGLALAPPHDHLGERVSEILPQGNVSGEILTRLMEKANQVLDLHPINLRRRAQGKIPANGIWFWAEGTACSMPSFREMYRKTGAVISAVPLCHGIAKLIGLEIPRVEGATGELETNYEGKVSAALDSLKKHDFVAVHIEAPDECSHNGDYDGKVQAIQWLDSRVIAPMAKALEDAGAPFRMLILSDHKTLLKNGLHDGDPVPYIIYDSRGGPGSGLPYTEKNGEAGPFLDRGTRLMDELFSHD